MPLSSFVHIRTQCEGIHHWPGAPDTESYLRTPHRHLFVVEVEIEVRHDDREIEINAATRWLDSVIPQIAVQPAAADEPMDFGSQSCEQIASRVTDVALNRYGRHRRLRCTVLEDGILGAGVAWQPEPGVPDSRVTG